MSYPWPFDPVAARIATPTDRFLRPERRSGTRILHEDAWNSASEDLHLTSRALQYTAALNCT